MNYIVKENKPIYQFDLQGNLVKVWKSIDEIPKYFQQSLIIANCLNLIKLAFGYYWSYKRRFNLKLNSNNLAVAIYQDNGEFIKSFTSIDMAALELKLENKQLIYDCISGKTKHTKGFRWRYFYGNTQSIKSL